MSETPRNILIAGASGGIGRAMLGDLLQRFPTASITASHFRSPVPLENPRLHWQQLDLRDADAIKQWSSGFERIDWLINCAGYLHGNGSMPEKNIASMEADALLESIRINTLPTLMLARFFATALKRSNRPLLATVSARVGSIEDNRLGGWYSYRISKAALNMALKTLSIEWKHSHPRGCVVALHPGTNDTALSKPFQARVAPENLFDPALTAAMFGDLLSRLEPGDSGQFRAWDGTRIPW